MQLSEPEPLFKIFVGNLAQGVTERDLKVLFVVYGTVAQCDVKTGYVVLDPGVQAMRQLCRKFSQPVEYLLRLNRVCTLSVCVFSVFRRVNKASTMFFSLASVTTMDHGSLQRKEFS